MFSIKGNIITLGVEPIRVDFINEVDGIEFKESFQNKVRGKYGNISVSFLSKSDLIKNKLSTKRLKDKADVEELQ